MKAIALILFLVITMSVSAEVNFELDMTLDKIENSDEVCKIWANDENDEIHITYKNDDLHIWRYIKYDYEGNVIQTYSKSYTENYEFYAAKEVSISDNTYMLQCYQQTIPLGYFSDNKYLIIKLYDCNNYYVFVDSLSYYLGYSYELQEHRLLSVSTIKLIDIDSVPTFHIGYKTYHYSGDWDFSYNKYSNQLLKLSIDDTLCVIENITDAASGLCTYSNFPNIISTAHYYYHDDQGSQAWGSTRKYIIRLLSYENPATTNEMITISGDWDHDWMGYTNYDHFPENCKFLTVNDESYCNYGMMMYNKETDSSTGIKPVFRCYSPSLDSTLWIRDDTNTGMEPIDASTCVSVNYEDHYVMYFRNNFLEIRDRINGDIVLTDSVNFIPSKIARDLSGNLLFFDVESSAINVYKLTEEIQLSTSEHGMFEHDIQLSNYPNPFKSSTNISFELLRRIHVEVKIYNIKGQLVADLIEAELPVGSHSVEWISKDAKQGIYFCKIVSEDNAFVHMILMR